MQKNKLKIDIYQGIIIPFQFDPPECMPLFQQLIADLTMLSIRFPLSTSADVTVSVTQLKSLQGEKRKRWGLSRKYKRPEVFLKFSTTIYFEDQNYPEIEPGILAANDFHIKHILIPNFEKRYYDFLMALDIARPGAVNHGQALLYANSKFIKRLTSLSLHSEDILQYTLETKWPTLESLDISKVWNWYLRRAFPAGLDELSNNGLSRAINAFSHLYNSSVSDIELLFWAMVGVESLYVGNTANVMEQVKKKAPLFLGEIREYKKRLTEMYDYRSGFFHGSKNFPNYFHIHDGLDSHEKFIEDYAKALRTATALLLATLQRMAKQDLDSLNFDYVWIG